MKRAILAAAALLGLATTSAGQTAGPVVEYYHLDAVGSVRAVTDQQGQVIRRHDYHPFGAGDGVAAGTDSLRFTGKERDPESGLDYFGARYYASRTGRVTTVDPLMGMQLALVDPQRWNRYSYVGNRPTRLVDLDGRGWTSALFKVGKALYKGGNIVAEFAGVVDDVQTVFDGDAGLGTRTLALGSLASEALPISGRDALAGLDVARRWISRSDAGKVSAFVDDFRTAATKNWSAAFKSEGEAGALARTKLGSDAVEVSPGKWRSRDGKWQYRAKPGDVTERHIHLEELDPRTGEVIQNVHLRWKAGTER